SLWRGGNLRGSLWRGGNLRGSLGRGGNLRGSLGRGEDQGWLWPFKDDEGEEQRGLLRQPSHCVRGYDVASGREVILDPSNDAKNLGALRLCLTVPSAYRLRDRRP